MARPVRTSNLLKEAAADHENLDRTAEQERLPVNRVATQPPVQENESVIEKAEEKEPSVQEKLDAILPEDFFGEFEDLFNSADVHTKEQIKQDMPPDSLPEAPATVTDDGAAQAVLEAAEEKADEEEIAPAINENTAEKMEEEIPAATVEKTEEALSPEPATAKPEEIVQRFTTTTDTKKLNKMMLTNGALSIFIATVFYLIGTGLFVFYKQNALPPAAAQDQIFASYIAFELPVGVTGLLLAAIYAAAQSTLSTGLNSVASSWALDIQSNLSKEELGFEKETKIGQRVSLAVGIFSIVVAMVLANGGVKSAYEWFNGFMGLVLGILIGTFILGAFTKVANTFGATAAFIAASAVMVYIKYFVPAGQVTIWSYSIISIAVSLVVGIPASIIWRNIKGDKSEPAPNTTIYKN